VFKVKCILIRIGPDHEVLEKTKSNAIRVDSEQFHKQHDK
jgi:hypothetical protein